MNRQTMSTCNAIVISSVDVIEQAFSEKNMFVISFVTYDMTGIHVINDHHKHLYLQCLCVYMCLCIMFK